MAPVADSCTGTTPPTSGAKPQAQGRQEERQKRQDNEPPVNPLDYNQEQTFAATVKAMGASTVLAMAEFAITPDANASKFDGEAASALHIEPAEFLAHRENITRSFEQAADKALAKVGVSNPGAFREWASTQERGRFVDAVTDLIDRGSVTKLQALGRRFAESAAGATQRASGDAGDLSPSDLAYVAEKLPYPTVANGPDDLLVCIGNTWTPLSELRRQGVITITRQ